MNLIDSHLLKREAQGMPRKVCGGPSGWMCDMFDITFFESRKSWGRKFFNKCPAPCINNKFHDMGKFPFTWYQLSSWSPFTLIKQDWYWEMTDRLEHYLTISRLLLLMGDWTLDHFTLSNDCQLTMSHSACALNLLC